MAEPTLSDTNLPPAPLRESSAAALGFYELRDLIAGYADSSLGKARIGMLTASRDLGWINQQQGRAAEMQRLFGTGLRFSFAGMFDPQSLLDRSRIEGVALEAEEIRNLLGVVDRLAQWRAIVAAPPEGIAGNWPEIETLSAPLLPVDFARLTAGLREKFAPDGTLADGASPALGRIRREIERQQRAIEEGLRATLRRMSEGGAVQEELITVRGERFVIPVKAEWKRRIPGVVHGTSSSGQTAYLEPLETIEQNNVLVGLLDDEQEEVRRILEGMTRAIAQLAPAIASGVEVLAEVESLAARALFARQYDCTRPRVDDSQNATVAVTNARHPLLERRLRREGGQIVPLTVDLGEARQLVISGPNTGGKTVALKTLGLLALMAQAGIPVPAEAAALPLFDAVLADIGDAQSIEQNLSTFSAHITNIRHIAQTASAHSLVLLDELGSATDPEEGAALAAALAARFLAIGGWSIISTHHTALKIYAANTPGVLNAAAGFDEHTLAPTYVLHVGIPGASAGISMALRLGLDPETIAAARQRLGTQAEDVGRFLDQLHRQITEIEGERQRLREREQAVAREQSRLSAEGMKEQRAKVRELEQKIESILKDFEYRMRETVRAIEDRAAQQKASRESERRIAQLRREFSEQFKATVVAHRTGADRDDPQAQPHVVRNVAVGDTVKLRSLGKNGEVRRQIDDNTFEVAVGAMKMRIARDDIAQVVSSVGSGSSSPLEAIRGSRGISVSMAGSGENAATELNVIGRTVDEATDELEKFLDRAFLSGSSRVRIVHGTGTGALRRALRAHLKSHPQVALVTEAPQNEGGGGATVVDLKL